MISIRKRVNKMTIEQEFIFEERLLEALKQEGLISESEHSKAIELLQKEDLLNSNTNKI